MVQHHQRVVRVGRHVEDLGGARHQRWRHRAADGGLQLVDPAQVGERVPDAVCPLAVGLELAVQHLLVEPVADDRAVRHELVAERGDEPRLSLPNYLTEWSDPIASRRQASGRRLALADSHCANVWSFGFSEREKARSRSAQYSFSKSALYWNMLPRSSAPGKPNVR